MSLFDGSDCLIFAYGETGSGKTFTIEGNEEHPGIVPKAINYLADLYKKYKHPPYNMRVKCWMVEIYMDEVKDLFAPIGSSSKKISFNKDGTI